MDTPFPLWGGTLVYTPGGGGGGSHTHTGHSRWSFCCARPQAPGTGLAPRERRVGHILVQPTESHSVCKERAGREVPGFLIFFFFHLETSCKERGVLQPLSFMKYWQWQRECLPPSQRFRLLPSCSWWSITARLSHQTGWWSITASLHHQTGGHSLILPERFPLDLPDNSFAGKRVCPLGSG